MCPNWKKVTTSYRNEAMRSQQRPTTWSMSVGSSNRSSAITEVSRSRCHVPNTWLQKRAHCKETEQMPHREKNKILIRTERRAHGQATNVPQPSFDGCCKARRAGKWKKEDSAFSRILFRASLFCHMQSRRVKEEVLNYHIKRVITK